jgi:hypothetical protein
MEPPPQTGFDNVEEVEISIECRIQFLIFVINPARVF